MVESSWVIPKLVAVVYGNGHLREKKNPALNQSETLQGHEVLVCIRGYVLSTQTKKYHTGTYLRYMALKSNPKWRRSTTTIRVHFLTGALDIQFMTVPEPDFNPEVNATDQDLAVVIRKRNRFI